MDGRFDAEGCTCARNIVVVVVVLVLVRNKKNQF
jgi:hypothetical protein